jgi:hypothetical protein
MPTSLMQFRLMIGIMRTPINVFLQGSVNQATVFGGTSELVQAGVPLVAFLVLATRKVSILLLAPPFGLLTSTCRVQDVLYTWGLRKHPPVISTMKGRSSLRGRVDLTPRSSNDISFNSSTTALDSTSQSNKTWKSGGPNTQQQSGFHSSLPITRPAFAAQYSSNIHPPTSSIPHHANSHLHPPPTFAPSHPQFHHQATHYPYQDHQQEDSHARDPPRSPSIYVGSAHTPSELDEMEWKREQLASEAHDLEAARALSHERLLPPVPLHVVKKKVQEARGGTGSPSQ